MHRRVSALAMFVALALVPAALAGASPDGAAEPVDSEPTAIVALGDSYISGEAGRWAGNSPVQLGDRRATDRAYVGFGRYDAGSVYIDGTDSSGCHRSDRSPIAVALVPVTRRINLACSGARTEHLIPAAAGGQQHKGEQPQVDQLEAVAASNAVELVAISIGGNDLGFDATIIECATDYSTSFLWFRERCADDRQAAVDQAMPAALEGVASVLAEVRAVLDANGDRAARIVLLSYPSPVPRGSDLRFDSNFERVFVGGCPFWSSDATWARDSLVPQIAAALGQVAADAGVEFLDLQDLLEGREICAEGVGHSDGSPTDVESEWARFLTTGLLQGEAQESLHPNLFGDRAIGRCIELVAAAEPGDGWVCENQPGERARKVVVSPVG